MRPLPSWASAQTPCAAGRAASATPRPPAPGVATASSTWPRSKPCAKPTPRPSDIASAISLVRQRAEGPSTPARLCAAFAEFSAEKADRLMEESLAVRSVERTVETVLLPAVEAMTQSSPEYCVAWRYATGWLAAAQRVVPPATREEGVLVFDASRPMDMDALYTQALELFLRRAGLRVLSPARRSGQHARGQRPARPGPASDGARPGATPPWRRSDASCTRRRQSGGELQVFDYRQALPDTGASTVAAYRPGPGRSGGHAARASRQTGRAAGLGLTVGAPDGDCFLAPTHLQWAAR